MNLQNYAVHEATATKKHDVCTSHLIQSRVQPILNGMNSIREHNAVID